MKLNEAKEALSAKTSGATTTAIEKKSVPVPRTMQSLKTTDVKSILGRYTDQIAQALPKHLTVDRVIQLATTLITRSTQIAACTTESLIGAVMQASILGFEPVAALGQCYFVPRRNKTGNEITFIIGYRGMIDLARRSGEILTLYAQAVYENDTFDYCFGLNPDITHKPAEGERGSFKYAYAVCKFKDGGEAFEVMSKADIDAIRKRSAAGTSDFSPWHTDYAEMAKKTVIRRLFKILPTSITKSVVTDEAVLKPDMFDQETKEIDPNKIEDAEFTITSNDEPETTAKQEPESANTPDEPVYYDDGRVYPEPPPPSDDKMF